MELLAPAGGPAQLNAALAAGADAIYLGLGHHFNARRGATGFDDESLAEACRRAHLAGARVYVTLNVVIRTDEMERALATARRAWLAGADALIVQDWGLLWELRRRWPQIELHLSTQANVHDARAVGWARDAGLVDRVTLSRELSLPELARIASEGVELEAFCHGALCVCYSGICMMSMLGGNRSANRGACAQPCRLPYELIDEKGEILSVDGWGRPLCPRDYRTIDDLDELRASGVSALKVEGRLKSPDYVHAVVRAYREALDVLEAGKAEEAEAVAARNRLLKRAFNRDFTNGYLWGCSDSSMMSYERSNNRGELVGKVVGSRDLGVIYVARGGGDGGRPRTRRMTQAEVDIALDGPVGKSDLLEVRPPQDPTAFLTTHAQDDAQAGEVIRCRTARPMPTGSVVRVIRSQAALDEAARVERSEIPRTRSVDVRVEAHLGQPLAIELTCVDGAASVRVEGFVVEAARTRAVTADELAEHVGRMGGSPFSPATCLVELDEGCGMGFSAVHKLRSQACRALADALLAPYSSRSLSRVVPLARIAYDLDVRAQKRVHREDACGHGADEGMAPAMRSSNEARDEAIGRAREVVVCARVSTPYEARAAWEAGASRVYASADALAQGTWPDDVILVPCLDEVCREPDHARLDLWLRAGTAVAVGNVSELVQGVRAGAKPELRSCIPVHNSSALSFFEEQGASALWLSPELSLDEIRELGRVAHIPLGLVVMGRTRAMTTEHCVLQVAGRCVQDCARCELRRKDLRIRSVHGEQYPVRTDLQGRSRVYAAHPVDATPELADLLDVGVTRLLVDATLMTCEELVDAVRHVGAQLRRVQEGRTPCARLAGHVAGHLHQPID